MRFFWSFVWFLLVLTVFVANGVDGDDDGGDGESSPDEILKEMDTDGDGKLSLAELLPTDMAEHEEAEQEMVEEITKGFKHSDKNGDGFIDRDELPGLMRFFEDEEGAEM